LASSGAAGGAAALAALVGGEPRAGRLFAPGAAELAAYETGAFFAAGGALEGAIAVLFRAGAREPILRALGTAASRDPRSALCEVANIVASQAACAIADGIRARVSLSVPRLAPTGAGAELARCLGSGRTALASELSAARGRARLLLVLLPGAEAPGCDTVAA
jgi:hypothetical protein